MKNALQWVFAIFLTAPVLGAAEEGALEINQACATGDGCFSGDTAGFPVQVSQAGRYILTGNVDVTSAVDPANTSAIVLSADDISLDLNGFTIRGPVTCTGTPVTGCSNTGIGDGIRASSTVTGISIRNGTVRGLGDNGILLYEGAVVADVALINNGDYGLRAGNGARVTRVLARRNAANGIGVLDNALVDESQSIGNGYVGINAGASSVVRNSVANSNDFNGIFIRDHGSAIDNVVRFNSTGVACFTPAAARGNVLSSNGSNLDTDCTDVADNLCDGAAC